mmetsp:Transcript_39139/g.110626  ORF Transcript_39139/g.110626 Transcript_39139/m.110626 type:complete len:253 (+) Transcript_39139:1663-2421(+)
MHGPSHRRGLRSPVAPAAVVHRLLRLPQRGRGRGVPRLTLQHPRVYRPVLHLRGAHNRPQRGLLGGHGPLLHPGRAHRHDRPVRQPWRMERGHRDPARGPGGRRGHLPVFGCGRGGRQRRRRGGGRHRPTVPRARGPELPASGRGREVVWRNGRHRVRSLHKDRAPTRNCHLRTPRGPRDPACRRRRWRRSAGGQRRGPALRSPTRSHRRRCRCRVAWGAGRRRVAGRGTEPHHPRLNDGRTHLRGGLAARV